MNTPHGSSRSRERTAISVHAVVHLAFSSALTASLEAIASTSGLVNTGHRPIAYRSASPSLGSSGSRGAKRSPLATRKRARDRSRMSDEASPNSVTVALQVEAMARSVARDV